MADGDELEWHFDQTDFVVSLALQNAGGRRRLPVRAAHPRARTTSATPTSRGVLAGDGARVRRLPMRPGTLLLFEGRYSIHCVSPVRGATPRLVATPRLRHASRAPARARCSSRRATAAWCGRPARRASERKNVSEDGGISVERRGSLLLDGARAARRSTTASRRRWSRELVDAFTPARRGPRAARRRGVRPRQALHRGPRPPEVGRRHEERAGATATDTARVDPFALARRCREARRLRGARHHLHRGHRAHARLRHRDRRRRLPLLPARAEARDHGDRRRHLPLRRARRLGQRACTTCSCSTSSTPRRRAAAGWCRRWCRRAPSSIARVELAAKIAALAPLAIQATKDSARLYAEQGEKACIAQFSAVQQRLANSEDAAEGVRSFVERREPAFTGPLSPSRPSGSPSLPGTQSATRLDVVRAASIERASPGRRPCSPMPVPTRSVAVDGTGPDAIAWKKSVADRTGASSSSPSRAS